jgi:hypothetical protein
MELEHIKHYQRDVTAMLGGFTGYFFGGRSFAVCNFGSSLFAAQTTFTSLDLLQDNHEWIMELIRDVTSSGVFLSRYMQEVVEGQLFAGLGQYEVWERKDLVYLVPAKVQDSRLPNLRFRNGDFFEEMVTKDELPSIGSIGHQHGNCKPCQFQCFGRFHCKNEDQCSLCHCDHVSKKKQKAIAWRQSHQQARDLHRMKTKEFAYSGVYRTQVNPYAQGSIVNLADLHPDENSLWESLRWHSDNADSKTEHQENWRNVFLDVLASRSHTNTTRSGSTPSGNSFYAPH